MFKIIYKDLQNTINKPFVLHGLSLYSRRKCSVEFMSASEDNGVTFEYGSNIFRADFTTMRLIEDSHTTTLFSDGLEIKTVEHLLSAIYGVGVDNIHIKLSCPDIPFLDASSEIYTKSLKEVGLIQQNKLRKYLVVKEEVMFKENEDDRYAIFKPSNEFKIISTTSFNTIIGEKTVEYTWSPQTYIDEICWARTFLRVNVDEDDVWEDIRKRIKLLPDNYNKSPIIVYTKNKFITPLKSDDEPARHKILDFIGDLSLLGIRVKGEVRLYKPGHRFTRNIVQTIAEEQIKKL